MNDFQNVYETERDLSNEVLRYYFVSKGKKDIIKAVGYQYVGNFNGIPLYNLGFGDYDLETNKISDEDVSNNNDQYKVLHTVLNTVPELFNTYGNVILMVQGSDSKPEFIAKCRASCSRKCGVGDCKKAHRRINIYRNFVDKNLEPLSEGYIFMGGQGVGDHNVIEPYAKGKKYGVVLVMRKNV
ncbi:MAG: hypothetical protein JST68_08480 [Bacteroidetes bacterium]|nr:hypothetical protein [Bacteroidota bacterium]